MERPNVRRAYARSWQTPIFLHGEVSLGHGCLITSIGLCQWETTLQCNVVSHWLRPLINIWSIYTPIQLWFSLVSSLIYDVQYDSGWLFCWTSGSLWEVQVVILQVSSLYTRLLFKFVNSFCEIALGWMAKSTFEETRYWPRYWFGAAGTAWQHAIT